MNIKREKNAGYIYIMTNPDMPGLVKVGMELSTLGVPIRFEVEYYGQVSNRFIAKKCVHDRFVNFHHQKEFFIVDVEIAIYCVETINKLYLSDSPNQQMQQSLQLKYTTKVKLSSLLQLLIWRK